MLATVLKKSWMQNISLDFHLIDMNVQVRPGDMLATVLKKNWMEVLIQNISLDVHLDEDMISMKESV